MGRRSLIRTEILHLVQKTLVMDQIYKLLKDCENQNDWKQSHQCKEMCQLLQGMCLQMFIGRTLSPCPDMNFYKPFCKHDEANKVIPLFQYSSHLAQLKIVIRYYNTS